MNKLHSCLSSGWMRGDICSWVHVNGMCVSVRMMGHLCQLKVTLPELPSSSPPLWVPQRWDSKLRSAPWFNGIINRAQTVLPPPPCSKPFQFCGSFYSSGKVRVMEAGLKRKEGVGFTCIGLRGKIIMLNIQQQCWQQCLTGSESPLLSAVWKMEWNFN